MFWTWLPHPSWRGSRRQRPSPTCELTEEEEEDADEASSGRWWTATKVRLARKSVSRSTQSRQLHMTPNSGRGTRASEPKVELDIDEAAWEWAMAVERGITA